MKVQNKSKFFKLKEQQEIDEYDESESRNMNIIKRIAKPP